jgi:SH3-like domain-containing protein
MHVAPPAKDNVQQSLQPNAVVDVPNVGLRKSPDITGRATFGTLRRGERVEIVRRISGKGPAWVKVKTKSGRVGWVFASVVKERKSK